MSLPQWLKKRAPREEVLREIKGLLRSYALHTVCEEAQCPNIGECFQKRTATFLILGDICTRNFPFCAVKKDIPPPLDSQEPENVARAVRELKLRYVVITSVTRDDLPDGGTEQFVQTIREIKKSMGKKLELRLLFLTLKVLCLLLKR